MGVKDHSLEVVVQSSSPDESISFAERLGSLLRAGDLILLAGDLGAGKTTLTRGLAAGLGVKERYITSPTFTLINEYEGRVPLYHVDLYRMSGEGEVAGLGLEDLFSQGVLVVEWAERAGSILPVERLEIELQVTGETSRDIHVRGVGKRGGELVRNIREML